VHTSEPHSRLVGTKLCGDRSEPFVEDSDPVMNGVGLGNFLPSVGNNKRNQSTSACD